MRSLLLSTFAANDTSAVDDDDGLYCKPDFSWNVSDVCSYVQNTDGCAGGGYVEWTTIVFCCEDPVAKWFIVAGAVLFLLLLFMAISAAADDFFSANVATIVAHLNISENVAGVTFMAFGNGAPDIFTSIASVLSSPQPKADLALGTLLGGATFVTLAVTSAIVITRPFKAAFWSTLRDLVFFLITLSFILSFFIFFDEIELWQPLSFLGIYVVYVIVVFTSEHFKKKKIRKSRAASKAASAIVNVILDKEEHEEDVRMTEAKRGSNAIRRVSLAVASVLGTGHDNGVFIEDPENDTDDFLVIHNKVYHGEGIRSRAATMIEPVSASKGIVPDLLAYFAPNFGDDDEPSTLTKIKVYLFWPIVTIFKLTIPLAEAPWSKPMAIILAILSPQCALFNTQLLLFVPIEGGPGLYAYVPIISIILIVFIVFATSMDKEPRFYKATPSKMTYCLTGFVMSVAWIYCISSEVVDAVGMLGVVSGIDQAVLGLTIIAWANSVGDLVADISVAKQGFPRMAMAASIGGPLFNQLIGFGLPFTIAKLKGDYVPISLDGVNVVLITFLFTSIAFTTLNLVVFRGYFKRLYGFALIAIYVAFLVFVILSETGILVWL